MVLFTYRFFDIKDMLMQFATPTSPLSPFPSLDGLLTSMMAMNDDPLADANTKVVISRGNPQAKILIVGEAPGPQENIQGKPFVGRAGQLLDKILASVKFDSEKDVYITNSVFRMPPGEDNKAFRKPSPDEITYYRKYVFEIIRLINPHIILLTGNVACHSVLDKTGITKLRGTWNEIDNYWVMPIFHPSYLLRNQARTPGSPKAQMWTDIQAIRQKYDELITKQTT